MAILGVVIVCLLAAGLLLGVVMAVVCTAQNRKAPPSDPFAVEEAPVAAQPATIGALRVEKQALGNVLQPGHRIRYMADFALQSGQTQTLEVPACLYETLFIGQTGTLLFQNTAFVGFEAEAANT